MSDRNSPTQQCVVLVTGAAGGLGQGLVREFSRQHWRVVAGFHRSLPGPEADGIWPLPMDVTQSIQVDNVVAKTLDRWGRIDVLINNAGIIADHLSWQIPDEDWDRVLDVHLKGAFHCAKAVLRPMLRQRQGHIINIASFSGRTGQRGQANYAAAKAGLLGLTASLAREVGSRNVRVNAVLPGVLPTGMTADLPAKALEHYAASNALQRLNSVEEVARFIVFLATLDNVSGQCFQLDSRVAPWT